MISFTAYHAQLFDHPVMQDLLRQMAEGFGVSGIGSGMWGVGCVGQGMKGKEIVIVESNSTQRKY